MERSKLNKAEQLLYDIAYSYLNNSDETVKPDMQICINSINSYFTEKEKEKQNGNADSV